MSVEDEVEFTPPPAERVAQRALVLVAIACRAGIESDAGNAKAEAFRAEVLRGLESLNLAAEIESRERALLEAPLGTLTERQVIDASWEGEGLAVLAWALGRYELPPYDQTAAPPDVADTLGFMLPEADTVLPGPGLRPAGELEAFGDRMLALHWRLREFSLRRAAMDFASFGSTCWFGPLDVEGLRFAGGDLEIDGRPLLDVPESRWCECLSIASERHRAANWLAGQDPIYSEVTLTRDPRCACYPRWRWG